MERSKAQTGGDANGEFAMVARNIRLWIGAGSLSGLLLTTGAAQASPAGLSLKANTLGIGADLTVNMGKWLNARAGFNYGQLDVSFSDDDTDFTGELRWRTAPILLDWHPTGGEFRVSLGGMINGNRIALSAYPDKPVKLQDAKYSVSRLEGRIEFNRFAPYVGIGYGNATGNGRFRFACDFGVMYHGKPRVFATVESELPPALQAELDRDLRREADEIQDDISGWRYYPVASLGFSVSF